MKAPRLYIPFRKSIGCYRISTDRYSGFEVQRGFGIGRFRVWLPMLDWDNTHRSIELAKKWIDDGFPDSRDKPEFRKRVVWIKDGCK